MFIAGMGSYYPKNIITNRFLEELDIGSEAAWIEAKIGILERRTCLPIDYIKTTKNSNPREGEAVMEESAVDMAEKAAHQALERAGLPSSAIGMLILNSCTPFEMIPSTGLSLAERLGIEAPAFDVFSACPAFALHMKHLDRYESDALPDYVLCVSTAVLTQRVDYNNRSDSAIWGDGAAAWVVAVRGAGRLEMLHTSYTADPLRCQAVVVDRCGHFHQDGRAVRDFSVRQTVRLVKKLETNHELNWQRDIFIGHQANKTMLDQITNNRKIPESNHWHNVTYIGNQAGAGAPAVLAEHWDDILEGQNIVVAVVGAGLSWGSVLLRAH